MFLFRAGIRMSGCNDFNAEVRADDQIQAKKIFESLYGKGCIIGNNVWRV
tara:strand:- start:161 stop:310 length:150 start_codon:yes stop_codon:yes gene_type:complete